jgi:hypothetical protein
MNKTIENMTQLDWPNLKDGRWKICKTNIKVHTKGEKEFRKTYKDMDKSTISILSQNRSRDLIHELKIMILNAISGFNGSVVFWNVAPCSLVTG